MRSGYQDFMDFVEFSVATRFQFLLEKLMEFQHFHKISEIYLCDMPKEQSFDELQKISELSLCEMPKEHNQGAQSENSLNRSFVKYPKSKNQG